MTLEFKLKNETLISYARTDDSVEAFERSVENGQTRLALEVLVELVDSLLEKIEQLDVKVSYFDSKPEEVKSKEDIRPKVKVTKEPGVNSEEV
jgi:transcription initiation factor IIE alpha subunit